MLVATLLCYLGFTALCLSMGRHYAELTGGTLSVKRGKCLRLAGWGALLLSLCAALAWQAPGLALLQWCAALMASAVLWLFVMSYQPGLALSLAKWGALLSPFAVLIQLLS